MQVLLGKLRNDGASDTPPDVDYMKIKFTGIACLCQVSVILAKCKCLLRGNIETTTLLIYHSGNHQYGSVQEYLTINVEKGNVEKGKITSLK